MSGTANGTDRLRLAFMGTPAFAVPALKALLEAGHDVVAVYSQPPRKAGRGQRLKPSPVHAFAEAQGIEVRTPISLKDAEAQRAFAELNADAAVVVAYGLILPKAILDAPKMGCFNIHASLLPRWRGAAPIQRAIEAGDEETGVTIMRMDEGLDTGEMVLWEAIAIPYEMNAQELHDVLSEMGGRLIVAALAGLAAGCIEAEPQPDDGVTYAQKIDKSETRIDWARPATDIAAQVQGLFPLMWFERDGQRVRILAARAEEASGPMATTLDEALLVACASGALRLTRVQPAGKGAMDAADYLRGHPLKAGVKLD